MPFVALDRLEKRVHTPPLNSKGSFFVNAMSSENGEPEEKSLPANGKKGNESSDMFSAMLNQLFG